MRLAVIGAGIAGLVAAASLQRDGHDVTVYEQREEPNADGAGLTLFGNAFTALDAVGLGDTVRASPITPCRHCAPDSAPLMARGSRPSRRKPSDSYTACTE